MRNYMEELQALYAAQRAATETRETTWRQLNARIAATKDAMIKDAINHRLIPVKPGEWALLTEPVTFWDGDHIPAGVMVYIYRYTDDLVEAVIGRDTVIGNVATRILACVTESLSRDAAT